MVVPTLSLSSIFPHSTFPAVHQGWNAFCSFPNFLAVFIVCHQTNSEMRTHCCEWLLALRSEFPGKWIAKLEFLGKWIAKFEVSGYEWRTSFSSVSPHFFFSVVARETKNIVIFSIFSPWGYLVNKADCNVLLFFSLRLLGETKHIVIFPRTFTKIYKYTCTVLIKYAQIFFMS